MSNNSSPTPPLLPGLSIAADAVNTTMEVPIAFKMTAITESSAATSTGAYAHAALNDPLVGWISTLRHRFV